MARRRKFGRIAIALIIFGSLSLLSLVLHQENIGEAVNNASLISMYATLIATGIALQQYIVNQKPNGPASPGAQLLAATDTLAEMVQAQWDREAVLRSLRRPSPLRAQLSLRGQQAAAAPVRPAGSARTELVQSEWSGPLATTVAAYRALPRRQMVVLGEPGAGKTVLALLMTLELLDPREPADPVPVLLPALSWNPKLQNLQAWISSRIIEDYPILRNADSYGENCADRLVVTGRILPVIDGLDEIPPELRALAISGIGQAWGAKPIIVTCRTIEYEAAIQQSGPLSAATTVQLEPVQLEEGLRYLQEDEPAGQADRWRTVADYMRANRNGGLYEVLSNPLMISLANSVYSAEGGDPAELLDKEKFPDSASIERHLLDAFITVAYTHVPPPPEPFESGASQKKFKCTPEQARRWLTELARHLQQSQTQDLAWWRLYRMFSWNGARLTLIAVTTLVAIAACGLVGGAMISVHGTVFLALAVGVGTAGSASAVAYFGTMPNVPVRNAASLRLSRNRFDRKVPFVVGALVPGLGAGIFSSLILNPGSGVYLGLLTALVGGFCSGLARWSLPSDNASAPSPLSSLTNDRRATMLHLAGVGLIFGVGIGVVTGLRYGAWLGAYGAVISGLAVGANFTMGTAYAWFAASRICLGLTRRLPWRLMAFMEDAHRRGVLRQAGATYQFRHARLREQLLVHADASTPEAG